MTTKSIALQNVTCATDPTVRKTKIICTLGPACWSEEGLGTLIDAGMNIARLNFSHGDHKVHGETLDRLRAAMASRPDKPVAVMLDTKGPEIRTGFFEEKFGGKLELKAGQDLELVTDYDYKAADTTKLAVSYPSLPKSVEVGGMMLAADGNLVMTVKEIRETSVLVYFALSNQPPVLPLHSHPACRRCPS